MTLCSAGLEISVPKRRMVPPGNTALIPTNWKLRWWPDSFVLLMFLNQQAKSGEGGVSVWAGVTDPDYQGKIGLLLHNGGKEEYV